MPGARIIRTSVGIVGAGPAGLLLSHLLHLEGIESVVIESRSRSHLEERVRAGVLEQGTVDLLNAAGVGERMRRQGLIHHGVELRFDRGGHRIDFQELTGRAITVYAQHEVIKDLINARLAAGGQILFEVEDVAIRGFEGDAPRITFRAAGEECQLACEYIAGCDGFHGVCRTSVPAGALRFYEKTFPFGWLGILARARPASNELIYANHERGFALLSMRTPDISRVYLQCRPDEELAEWPDERIWEELQRRFETADGFRLNEGPIFQKGVTPMRSFVTEPMQFGRLFLGGRRRTHRPAHGRQGPEPGRCGRVGAGARSGPPVSHRLRSAAAPLLGGLSAPRVARAALLLVDDFHVAPLRGEPGIRSSQAVGRARPVVRLPGGRHGVRGALYRAALRSSAMLKSGFSNPRPGNQMGRTVMNRMVPAALLGIAAVAYAQGQPAGRGGPQGGFPPMGTTPKPAIANVKAVRSCESLATVALPNTTIESAALDATNPGICRVTAVTTHPPAGDKVRIWIGIPTENWNGRFLGTGGGGFSGGSAGGINPPLALGYASGATDTGHPGGSGAFALDANGRLNWQAIRDNAYLGIHEMTETGKALTQAMYGVAPRYAYFDGCSTGGRQALMEAQRYPQDYNGIVSGAPAINWPKLMMQSLWGTVQMNAAANPLPACKLAAATAAAVAACDAIDGVKDGVIENPERCTFDPKALIGVSAGDCGTFTEADANMIRMLWDGPRHPDGGFLWYGQPRGADLNALAASRGTPLKPQAFVFSVEWLKFFLTENPQFDWTTVTPAAYQLFWDQSVEEYGLVIGTDNPDLTAFRDHGGKAIVWHGWADQLISAEGTIDYYKRVRQQMGGAEKTAQFARLFLAPGVGHCGGGPGPTPYGQLDALRGWVEDGNAPKTLTAARRDQTGAITRSRPLCQYPLVAKYKGTGSTDDAKNFVCSTGF